MALPKPQGQFRPKTNCCSSLGDEYETSENASFGAENENEIRSVSKVHVARTMDYHVVDTLRTRLGAV